MLKVEIITIGDEILIGQTVDTNSAWMGEELRKIGAPVHRITSIHDIKEAIVNEIDNALGRSDVILMTGGLGPTKDDITKYTLAEYFGCELVLNEEVLGRIRSYFEQRGREMLQSNIDQAKLPSCAKVIDNFKGTASGMWFEKEGKIVVSMPGVPYEMKGMMEETILPSLRKLNGSFAMAQRILMTQGIGESFLAEIIKDWETEYRSKGFGLAYLPSPGIVKLRLTAKGENEAVLYEELEAEIERLKPLIQKFLYSEENEQIEEVIGELLRSQNATLSTAESCTGGYVAHLITSIPGSSDYFQGSVVSYSNKIKEEQLGVSTNSLRQYGAVSQQVVEEMAKGVREKLGTTYGVSTSGIAGPDGGTEEKPLGTVWIAVAGDNWIVSKKLQLGNDRERNIHVSAISVLNLLRKEILSRK